MTQARGAFVRYLFKVKHVNRLELAIDPENVASRRVAEKCGFRSEGIARQAMYSPVQNRHEDMERFAILRSEAAGAD